MIKVFVNGKKNPKFTAAFKSLEQTVKGSKIRSLKKIRVDFNVTREEIVGDPVTVDMKDNTITVSLSKVPTQKAIVPLTCLLYAKALLQIGANNSLWKKHFQVNKSLIKPYLRSFSKVVVKYKSLFINDKLSMMGLAVALFRYKVFLEGALSGDDVKLFKKTFLPFFEDVFDEDDSEPLQTSRLDALTSEVQKYASLPEKVLSTAAVDKYLPSDRQISRLADEEDLISFVNKELRDLPATDLLEALEDENFMDVVVEKIDMTQVKLFMQEVLGEQDTRKEGDKEVEFDPLEGKEKASLKFQREQANCLSALANVFGGGAPPSSSAFDKTAPVEELIGNNPRFIQSLDEQAKEMTSYVGASNVDENTKAYWKGLFEKSYGGSEEFDKAFGTLPVGEHAGGYDWYASTSALLEKFKVVLSRNNMTEADTGEYFEAVKTALEPPVPDPDTPVITMGPIKGASRARSKILKYDQDISQLGDIVRFTVVVDNDLSNFNEVFRQIEETFGAMDVKVASQIESKFNSPTPVGYGDINFSVFFENLGLAGEVQITTPAMAAAKKQYHVLYEKTRNIEALASAVNQIFNSDTKGFSLLKALVAVRQDLVDKAKDADKAQMKAEFKRLISPIQNIDTAKLETIAYKDMDTEGLSLFGSVDQSSLAQAIKVYSNSFLSLDDLADFENNCRVQLDGYNEARGVMSLAPHESTKMLLRTSMQNGKVVINSKIQAKIEEVLISKNPELKGKALKDAMMKELLKRDFNVKDYTPNDYDFAKQARKKQGSLIGGFYMIEGIPYSWDGFGALPKFFTGANPRGCVDYEVSEFLVKARPITEDVFHNRVAELTLEQAEKREKKIAMAENIIEAIADKPNKTASLRSQVIRLAHAKPKLRGHLLPLLKEAKDYSAIFDKLSKGKKIQVALTTYGMSSGQGVFDGQLHDFVVGRSSYSKKWGVESKVLIPVIDGTPKPARNKANKIVMMRRANGNVSVAFGDMATNLINLRL
jgi:hypothetical protein